MPCLHGLVIWTWRSNFSPSATQPQWCSPYRSHSLDITFNPPPLHPKHALPAIIPFPWASIPIHRTKKTLYVQNFSTCVWLLVYFRASFHQHENVLPQAWRGTVGTRTAYGKLDKLLNCSIVLTFDANPSMFHSIQNWTGSKSPLFQYPWCRFVWPFTVCRFCKVLLAQHFFQHQSGTVLIMYVCHLLFPPSLFHRMLHICNKCFLLYYCI